MEAREEFEVDHLTAPIGTSFSQLLFGDDDDDHHHHHATALPLAQDHYSYSHNHLFSFHKPPKMLCFGDHQNQADLLLPQTNVTPQKSVITSSDSSSASSSNYTNSAFNSLPKSNSLQKKRNGLGQEAVTKVGVGGQRQTKKNKAENPTSTGHAKQRKEKLGERIAALQQLVSPFGKTDTASVLHEAMGYIRFLHDQVHVLCSPYLQSLPSSPHQHQHVPLDGDNILHITLLENAEPGLWSLSTGDGENNEEEVSKDLRSRGLCLIPVGCTGHVGSSNGADFWSPGAIGNKVSPSAKHLSGDGWVRSHTKGRRLIELVKCSDAGTRTINLVKFKLNAHTCLKSGFLAEMFVAVCINNHSYTFLLHDINLTRKFDPEESAATNSIWIGLLLTNSLSPNADVNTELALKNCFECDHVNIVCDG
ncbi:unnamed protein product [Sphenostylis stenocarpa]|uniref:BHLH domain-containing protein n=1 Tax=Sphenostylis stenocarpa TaxID=92480 RepID=A0AA86W3H3_9FABA|nr:unnamed protein product [Sphenostylis stenocarpa]